MNNIGMIYVFNNQDKSSIYSRLQHFFTKMPYSHTAIGAGDIMGDKHVLSSDHLCFLQPIETYIKSGKITQEVFKFKKASYVKTAPIIKKLHLQYSGTTYGYVQILWFAYRWLMEKLGKDVRKHHNWFATRTVICSELSFLYLHELADMCQLTDLKDKLNEWHKDNVHVGDIRNIITCFPQYFDLVSNENL